MKKAPLQKYVEGTPFERLGIDVLGPLPVTNLGNRYIVVVVDYFTKWPEAFPVPDIKAETVAHGLIDNVISRFGVPREIHSDQGTNFESTVFKEVTTLLNVHKTRATPLHPQSSGLVERFNRTLWASLAKVVGSHQRDWDLKLPCVLLAYRATEHSTMGYSPSKLVMGQELVLPMHQLVGSTQGTTPQTAYAQMLKEQLLQVHEIAWKRLLHATETVKRQYDVRSEKPRLET